MSKFYVPTNSPEDWKSLLAEPDKHWKTGYSAKSLAYCWDGRDDFPATVKSVFMDSNIRIFQDCKLLLAFPEYKVALPGGGSESQNDIFVLASGDEHLVSITVEGKVDETFGPLVSAWRTNMSDGKTVRLAYLCRLLHLDDSSIGHVRYQLLHRTASALILAETFNARNALMLVHRFNGDAERGKEGFSDYCQFLALFGLTGRTNAISSRIELDGVGLYFGWVQEKTTDRVQA